MKEKKGFTLVELLAVIAILAILVIIALPNIFEMFNNAKQKAFETEVKNIYGVAQETFINDSLYDGSGKTYSHCNNGSCNDKLKLNGGKNMEYYIEFDSSGNVIKYYATNGSYQYSYEGAGLKKDQIGNTEYVPNVSEDNKVVITNEGNANAPEPQPQTIQVCKIEHFGYGLDVRITNIDGCNNSQTVGECINVYLGGRTTMYLYKTHESNPGEETIDDCYRNLAASIGSPTQSNIWQYNSNCSNKEGVYYTRVNKDTDIVVPSTEGCYATDQIYMTCLDGDTEIEVYDKKKKKKLKKKLKDLTYDDLVRAWDFDECKYVWVNPFWIMKPVLSHESITLTFSDGRILKVVGDHRIFDCDKNKFVSCKEAKLGLRTITSDGNTITLTNKEIKQEDVYAYNAITSRHINFYANGILASQGSNNIYEFKDMKFVKEDRSRFTKEELKDIPKEYIDGLRLDEWITDDKGSREETLIDMHNYINHLKNNKK